MVDHQLARILIAFRAQNRENRTENLVTIDRHVGRHMIKQRTADKKAVLIALQFEIAAIDNDRGASRLALMDVILDPGF